MDSSFTICYFMCILYIFSLNIIFSVSIMLFCACFQRWLIALDMQLLCSSMEKNTSPTPGFLHLVTVFCVALRPHGLFHVKYGMSMGVILFEFTFEQSFGETFCVLLLLETQSHRKFPSLQSRERGLLLFFFVFNCIKMLSKGNLKMDLGI